MEGRGRDPHYHQRGQAVFLVLIAIVLFAALAWVVSQIQPDVKPAIADTGLRSPQRLAT